MGWAGCRGVLHEIVVEMGEVGAKKLGGSGVVCALGLVRPGGDG